MSDVFERRSVNFFDKGKNIDEALLEKIIDLGVTAPSAFNLQPWDIIAVSSSQAKERLLKVSSNQPKITEAPVSLIILGDRDGYKEGNPVWGQLEAAVGKEGVTGMKQMAAGLYGSTEERKVKFAESNAGLLSMSIMYAAKHYGVDSHAMSGIDFEGIKKEFSVEGNKEVVMVICLGYFDESNQLFPKAPRRTYKDLVKTA